MESNPLRGLFGVSSPRQVEQRVAPQPTELTENENVCFEILSGMIEKLLANPFLGDGTKHPDEHLLCLHYVKTRHTFELDLHVLLESLL